MPVAFTEWTVDLLDALPDSSERFELIDGELYVTPSPGLQHQDVVLLLASLLREYTRRWGFGKAIISPSDVRRGDFQKNRVQPDIYVVRLTNGQLPSYPFHLRDLLLAVEVANPGKPFLDYDVKRRLYLSEGVAEYWIVGVEERCVTRLTSASITGELLTESIEWHPAGAPVAFRLNLPDFFDEALR